MLVILEMRPITLTTTVLLAVLIALIACGDRRALVHDTAAAQQQASAVPMPAGVPTEVSAVCGEVAADWRRIPNIALHQVSDTMLMPEIGVTDSQVRACRVVAEDSLALAKSDSVRVARDGPSKSAYWRTFARAGWVQLHWSADGPDGSLTTYHRGRVRCQLQEEWDGGDDSDSTAVTSPFYRQTTSCWSHPAGIVKTDTMPY